MNNPPPSPARISHSRISPSAQAEIEAFASLTPAQYRALPAEVTERERASLPPNTLAVLSRPGSSTSGPRSQMGIIECLENLRRLRAPNSKPVTDPSRAPRPKATQEEMEREIYGLVNKGLLRPAAADRLIAGMARAASENAASGIISGPRSSALPLSEEDSAWEKRLRFRQHLTNAGLHDRYWDLRIDHNPFLTDEGKPYDLQPFNREAFGACRRLAHDWSPGAQGLTLQSVERGVSKTLLAAAACVYIIAQKTGKDGRSVPKVKFIRAGDLFGMFALSKGATWERNPGVASTEQVWQEMAVRPEVLVIDDLGTEPWTRGDDGEWVKAKFYALADFRYAQKLTTIITTQLDTEALTARFGGHVASRLLARSPMVSIIGSPDYRQDAVVDDSDPFAD